MILIGEGREAEERDDAHLFEDIGRGRYASERSLRPARKIYPCQGRTFSATRRIFSVTFRCGTGFHRYFVLISWEIFLHPVVKMGKVTP